MYKPDKRGDGSGLGRAALTECPRVLKLSSSLIFFLKIFLIATIFKVFIEFVTVLLLFYVLVF